MSQSTAPSGTEHESWWVASTDRTSYPPLAAEPADADVVVLGAGIAGLTTAYALTQAGRSVTVVEAGRIAEGVSGYTTAKVSVGHNLVYADLRDKHGPETAATYAASQSHALEWLCETVEREGIDCELERLPAVVYTESEDETDTIADEAAAATEAGLPVEQVSETSLPFPVVAGVRYPDQAQFHPRRYLLALAERIVAAGGRILEGTRALEVSPGDDPVVTTDHGEIRARDVVVATHYPFLDRGLLFARLAPYRDVVVSYAVPEAQAPTEVTISTGSEEGGTHSVRSAPYSEEGKRLLIVTGGQYKTGSTSDVESQYDDLDSWARERFGVGEPVYRWSTQDTSSADRLPFIGRLPLSGDHVWVATGFSAWGMTGGTMAGLILSDLICGVDNPWASTYDPGRINARASASKLVKENVDVAKELVGGSFRTDVGSVEELAPGEAGILRSGLGRVAAYRDDSGAVHAVSARCTHLGCTVRFNDAERSWDCPCHGSRFGVDGEVLHGPAVQPLERREV